MTNAPGDYERGEREIPADYAYDYIPPTEAEAASLTPGAPRTEDELRAAIAEKRAKKDANMLDVEGVKYPKMRCDTTTRWYESRHAFGQTIFRRR